MGHDMVRYDLALRAGDIGNLIELARILTSVAQEAAHEGVYPHLDPAVQLVCYQIAQAGNGNLPANGLYERLREFCLDKVTHGPNFKYLNASEEAVAPVYEPN